MTQEQRIHKLIKKGESQSVEFKQAASSAKDLAREIVALANTCLNLYMRTQEQVSS